MTETLAVRIELTKEISHADSQWLQRVDSHVRQELEVESKLQMTEKEENAMSGGMAVAIAIAGLAVTALGTLFEIIKFYIEQKRNQTLTIVGDGYSRQVSQLTKDEVEAIVSDIEARQLSELLVRVGD
jgi:hypothetical protein